MAKNYEEIVEDIFIEELRGAVKKADERVLLLDPGYPFRKRFMALLRAVNKISNEMK